MAGLVGKRAVVGERRDPSLDVFVLAEFVRLPDDLLIVQCHVVLLNPAIDRPRVAVRQVRGNHRILVIRHAGRMRTLIWWLGQLSG
jgi:hypothetical protein